MRRHPPPVRSVGSVCGYPQSIPSPEWYCPPRSLVRARSRTDCTPPPPPTTLPKPVGTSAAPVCPRAYGLRCAALLRRIASNAGPCGLVCLCSRLEPVEGVPVLHLPTGASFRFPQPSHDRPSQCGEATSPTPSRCVTTEATSAAALESGRAGPISCLHAATGGTQRKQCRARPQLHSDSYGKW